MGCYFCNGNLSVHLKTSEYTIIKCLQCGIAFTSPSPSLPQYENMEFGKTDKAQNSVLSLRDLSELPVQWQKLIHAQVGCVTENLAKNKRVLEIGCGEGILLDQIAKKGYFVQGVEPSHRNAERARLRNINVIESYFDSETTKDKFDAIIMSHVLEHTEYPEKIINDIIGALNPDGYLILTQTNYKGIIPAFLKDNWYAWVPEQHYWHFTSKGLIGWLKTKGFILKYKKNISLVHPGNIKYAIINAVNSAFPFLKDQYIIVLQKASKK